MKTGYVYSDEFKETIVNIILNSDKSIAQIALELGLSDRTLYKWTYVERITKNIGLMNLDQEKKLKHELQKTRNELKQAKKEITILSKLIHKKFIPDHQ